MPVVAQALRRGACAGAGVLSAALLLSAALGGCSSGSSAGAAAPATRGADGLGSPGTAPPQGRQPDAGAARLPDTAAKPTAQLASVDTVVSPHFAQAGQLVAVACAPLDAEGNLIDEAFASSFDVTDGPGDAQVEPDGSGVRFTVVGTYHIQCSIASAGLVDETPAEVQVVAGPPAEIDTAVEPHQVKAGGIVEVTCTAKDSYGNVNDWATLEPVVAPEEGWARNGFKLKFGVAGTYAVACWDPTGGAVDETPETVDVSAGLPRRIYTVLDTDTIQAGGATKVSCVVTDAYDNPVEGFPVSLDMPPQVVLDGFNVASFVAGTYTIRCVPSTDPWDLYELYPAALHVVPGPPADLVVELVPPKPTYFLYETVQFLISVVDEWGNVIPDAQTTPLTPVPADGAKALGPASFQFKKEGKYQFDIAVVDHPDISTSVLILVDGTGPLIVVEKPSRAETRTGKPSVNVEGFVNDEVSGVVSLLVNGDVVKPKADGTFSYIQLAHHGMNLVSVDATDLAGVKSHSVRSFFWSPQWYEVDASNPDQSKVPGGITLWLGQKFLDDGDHSEQPPNDMASILEHVIANFDLTSAVPNPAASFKLILGWKYELFIEGITIGKPYVGLDTFDGGLNLNTSIPNINLKLKLVGSCNVILFDICPDFSGTVHVDNAAIAAKILASTTLGGPKVELGALQATLAGLDVNINGILGELLDFLIDWVVGLFADKIEQAFQNQVASQITNIFETLFGSFAINTTFEVPAFFGGGDPIVLTLASSLGTIDFTEAGGVIGLDATVVAPKKVAFNPLGSIGRAGCGKGPEPPVAFDPDVGFAVAIHDDFINQILFSVWWAGALDADLGSDLFGDLSALSDAGLQGLSVAMKFFAPPMVSTCNPSNQLTAQVGDAFFDVSTSMLGQDVKVGIFASFEAEADLGTTEDPVTGDALIGIELGQVLAADLDIVSITPGFESIKPTIQDMIQQQLLGGVLDSIGGQALPGFPVPAIDLATLDSTLPAGTVLKFDASSLERQGGYTVLSGGIQ